MINAGQMETIPLSSDSESDSQRPKMFSQATNDESFNSASHIMTMGERPNSTSVKGNGKGTIGPTPDLIPLTDVEASGGRGRGSVTEQTSSDGDRTVIQGTQENEDEADEEKQRLIAQVLELQHTLEDLSSRVDSVKEENLKLRSENQILGQYIENLMAASSVFQSSTPRMRRKASSGQAVNKSAAAKLQHQ